MGDGATCGVALLVYSHWSRLWGARLPSHSAAPFGAPETAREVTTVTVLGGSTHSPLASEGMLADSRHWSKRTSGTGHVEDETDETFR